MRFSAVGSILFFAIYTLLNSCSTANNFIPSYVQIDSVNIDAKSIQGNNIHQISAVECFVDEALLGVFPVPSKIPVNAEGIHKISFIPYVKNNGSNSQFVPYLSLKWVDTMLTLRREKMTLFTPKFNYRSNAQIDWQVDFESFVNLIPINVRKGDTTYIDVVDFELGNRFHSNSHAFKAVFETSDSAKFMDLGSLDIFKTLPLDGTDVMLEFDVKSDLPVQVSLNRYNPKTLTNEIVPYVQVYPTSGKWKRIYTDLVYELNSQPAGTTIQILFSIDKPEKFSGSHEIYFDNIRLSHLK